jgi:hypothetical protein
MGNRLKITLRIKPSVPGLPARGSPGRNGATKFVISHDNGYGISGKVMTSGRKPCVYRPMARSAPSSRSHRRPRCRGCCRSAAKNRPPIRPPAPTPETARRSAEHFEPPASLGKTTAERPRTEPRRTRAVDREVLCRQHRFRLRQTTTAAQMIRSKTTMPEPEPVNDLSNIFIPTVCLCHNDPSPATAATRSADTPTRDSYSPLTNLIGAPANG